MNNISIEVNGSIITGLQWGDNTKPVLLAVHGWLDNAASFVPLANALRNDLEDGSLPYQLIAIDLPGHGYSDHKAGHYNFIEWVDDLYQIIKTQHWGPVSIIGHSMGAMISSILAATFPELVRRIVLIEGLGAISAEADQTVSQLRKGIENRALYNKSINQNINQSTNRKDNALTLEKVVKARCFVSDLNEEHAKLICNRNLTINADEVSFCSDPKLKAGSLVRLSESQVIDILSSISTACLIIIGDKGFPLIAQTLNLELFCKENFKILTLSGGHHVHMDNAVKTARAVVKFVNN
ncbi:alpha/beta hydrolase [Moritella sp. Urea-trap-13]|uniref:alpha/beta hydrolase n=1 Tax=Moritella sp. Urea-trap-13 TaxID=2058327 RepID=UPI000C32BE3B|nr:alpha/beta hydrolase [Moritella sp. Urea-trap-13]PKH06296.1 alpha/beta hydrolase [Moritella sp. Urea-trap-13]